MRRKSDMWRDEFLPEESAQDAKVAAAETRDRVAVLEEQLKSQFTSMSAYHQIAQQAVDTARAEARADLEREKASLISLIERARNEFVTGEIGAPVVVEAAPVDVTVLARLALLEDKFDQLVYQFAQCMRLQEDLANSIAFVFEQQVRTANGYAVAHAD